MCHERRISLTPIESMETNSLNNVLGRFCFRFILFRVKLFWTAENQLRKGRQERLRDGFIQLVEQRQHIREDRKTRSTSVGEESRNREIMSRILVSVTICKVC